MILLGTGELNWDGSERRSDRYGTINLWQDEDSPIILEVESGVGQLIVKIIATKESTHIGDIFRGLFPSTPNVGDTFVLGTGNIFYEESGTYVGLKPDDGRYHDWLDPEVLYQVHEQDVELYFKKLD